MKLHIAVNYDRNDGDTGFANFLIDDCPGPPMTAETIGWVREKLMSGGIRDCRAVVILNWQYLEVPDRGVGNSSEMVERVARAIYSEPWRQDWSDIAEGARDYWRKYARAAIAAMREPTEAMEAAGAAAEGGCEPSCEHEAILRPGLIWQAMIDAAREKRE